MKNLYEVQKICTKVELANITWTPIWIVYNLNIFYCFEKFTCKIVLQLKLFGMINLSLLRTQCISMKCTPEYEVIFWNLICVTTLKTTCGNSNCAKITKSSHFTKSCRSNAKTIARRRIYQFTTQWFTIAILFNFYFTS